MTPLDIAFALWMVGVSAAHGARFFLFKDALRRKIVAGGGVLVYGLSAVLCLLQHSLWAYGIATLFPLVGLSVVLVSSAVDGKTEPEEELEPARQLGGIDHWQLAVGFTQFPALFFASYMLIRQWVQG